MRPSTLAACVGLVFIQGLIAAAIYSAGWWWGAIIILLTGAFASAFAIAIDLREQEDRDTKHWPAPPR